MQKAKLGISVGVLGAAMCFSGLFSGYIIAGILAGYILLMEENVWLKKTAVKTIAVMMVFSAFSVLIGFIPDVIGIIDDVFGIFNGSFHIYPLTSIVYTVRDILNLLESVLLLALGLKALNQGTIKVPTIDKFVDKAFGE